MQHTQALRIPEVRNRTGLSNATIWRKIKQDPTFPKPFKLGANSTVWDAGEITAWLEGKKAERCQGFPYAGAASNNNKEKHTSLIHTGGATE